MLGVPGGLGVPPVRPRRGEGRGAAARPPPLGGAVQRQQREPALGHARRAGRREAQLGEHRQHHSLRQAVRGHGSGAAGGRVPRSGLLAQLAVQRHADRRRGTTAAHPPMGVRIRPQHRRRPLLRLREQLRGPRHVPSRPVRVRVRLAKLPQLRDLEDRGGGPGGRGFRGPGRPPRAAPAAPPERDRAAAGAGRDADRPLRGRQGPVRRGTVRRFRVCFAGDAGAVPRRRRGSLPAVAVGVALHRRGLVLAGENMRSGREGWRTD